MKINLDAILHDLTRTYPFQRPTIEFLTAKAKYEIQYGSDWPTRISPDESKRLSEIAETPMTLGYFICDALPAGLPEKAAQEDKIKMTSLQARIIQGGTQDFTIDQVAFMKRAIWESTKPNFLFIAGEASQLLEQTAEVPITPAAS